MCTCLNPTSISTEDHADMFSGRAPGSFPAGAESLLSKSLKNKESPDSSGFLQENTTLLLKDFWKSSRVRTPMTYSAHSNNAYQLSTHPLQPLDNQIVHGDSLVHGTPFDFSHREIKMRCHITSGKAQYVLRGLSKAAIFLQNHPSSSATTLCNSRKQSQHFRDNLEQKLNKMKLNVDVLHINGTLHKVDKFWWIRLFCDETHICNHDFRALVTTNAANVGIDKHLIALQMIFKFPRDLPTYFQERGRGSHTAGTRSTCIVYVDLALFVFLVTQTAGEDYTRPLPEDTANDVGGFNSASSPQ